MGLSTYKKKRNFKNTPEPGGTKAAKKKTLSFVVQRHAASHLHYDFRLEMEGVLKSWAVPKGPSMKAGERRLAVLVEDHPLEYGKFYGEIPKGNYGAGKVDIWDEGTYEPLEKLTREQSEKLLIQQLKKGDLKFKLNGKHLNGSFALVRMNDGEGKNWLLIKKKDEHTKNTFNIEKIKPVKLSTDKNQVWVGGKAKTEKKSPAGRTSQTNVKPVWKKLQKPMLATLTNDLIDDERFIYEPKYDGYRAITKITGGDVEMISRNGHSFNHQYQSLVKELQKVKNNVIIDGEVVIEDKKGVSDFQLLQNYPKTQQGTLKYYVFDVLFFEGYTLTSMALLQRKELLAAFFKKYKFTNIHESPYVRGKGNALYKKYATKGYEGIVAKEIDSKYESGRRSDAWLKIKTSRVQEAVICGYNLPLNSREYFGSLILGVYDDGKLKYIGNCGTGFTDASLKELHGKLSKYETPTSPFEEKIPFKSGRGKPVWLKPYLVCNVKFQEWTQQGHMRIPVFDGLRTDKNANDVIREDMSTADRDNTRKRQRKGGKAKTKKTERKAPGKTGEESTVKSGGKEVKITNAGKIYWPGEKITKGDLINYYHKISKVIIPYLKNRPQSLNRHPNGIKAPGFYQKDMDVAQLPEWAKTAKIYSKSNSEYIDYLLCNDEATLLYMANLGCIEINPWHSVYTKPDYPDYMMLDLDPGNIAFVNVVNAALIIKEICDEIKVECFCKTSGATGLHVYIPLGAKYTYDKIRVFAQWIAQVAHERLPDTTSVERSVAKRRNKIYLDFLQNSKGQTIASAYSVRPRPHATVSTPLLWKEVNHKLDPTRFTIFNTEKRLAKMGDLWKGVLGKGVDLKKVFKEIEKGK